MTCSPRNLFELAERIKSFDSSEAGIRCVVSRAYYAALHQVDSTFKKREDQFRVDGESSHAEIISRALVYGRSTLPGRGMAAVIAKEMTRLRRERNIADYKFTNVFPIAEAENIVIRTARVLDMCDEIIKKAPSSSSSFEGIGKIETIGPKPSLK